MAVQQIRFVVVLFVASFFIPGERAEAQEPGWSPVVIPTGEYREQIKSMPIEARPYRPLHFYGNTVRRNHYRGNPVVTPKDLRVTTRELIRPR